MAEQGERKPLLTLKEAAELLSMGYSTLHAMCKRKEVPHRRIAGIKFSDQDIAEILESSKREREEPKSRKPNAPRPRLKHVRL